MIKSKHDLKKWLETEKKVYYSSDILRGGVWMFKIREVDILWTVIRRLRITEYHLNSGHKIRYIWSSIRLRYYENKWAIHIPVNTCDIGLSVAHVGPILIHHDCKIGKNLRIHVGANIGANGGKPPIIGNDVYIGPGAKIFGEITIADKCKIGANAVVNKSCLQEGCTLVGVPARYIQPQK